MCKTFRINRDNASVKAELNAFLISGEEADLTTCILSPLMMMLWSKKFPMLSLSLSHTHPLTQTHKHTRTHTELNLSVNSFLSSAGIAFPKLTPEQQQSFGIRPHDPDSSNRADCQTARPAPNLSESLPKNICMKKNIYIYISTQNPGAWTKSRTQRREFLAPSSTEQR